MKKLLFAVFAHPDDEAFGPSGTLILEALSGTELHLMTLTGGESGKNPDGAQDLSAIRLAEWRKAAKIMRTHSTHHLGYRDGTLSNDSLIEIQDRITGIVVEIAKQQHTRYEIEMMSIDDNGITGHIDHTVASRAATYAFYKLRQDAYPMVKIRYVCAPRSQFPDPNTDWLYMPAGRLASEIDETIDARTVLNEVREVVRCHKSQRQDGDMHLRERGEQIAINHFIVRS